MVNPDQRAGDRPLAFLSKWAAARRGSSWFAGIERTVAPPGSVRWDTAPMITPLEAHEIIKRMFALPRYRAPVFPPGWTMSEYGPLPPGWTVVNGKPRRAE